MPDGTICQGISITFIHNDHCEGQLDHLTRDEWKKSLDIHESEPALRDENGDLDNFKKIITVVDMWIYVPEWRGWIPRKIQYLTSADAEEATRTGVAQYRDIVMMDYVADAAATIYSKNRLEDLEKLPDVPNVARPLLQQNSNTIVTRAIATACAAMAMRTAQRPRGRLQQANNRKLQKDFGTKRAGAIAPFRG